MVCHHNLGMPRGRCVKSLHQEVAAATISLKVLEEAFQRKGNKLVSGTSPLTDTVALHPDMATWVLTGHGLQSNTPVTWFCLKPSFERIFHFLEWNFKIYILPSNFISKSSKLHRWVSPSFFLEGGKGDIPPFQWFSVLPMCQITRELFLTSYSHPGRRWLSRVKHDWLRSRPN